MQWLPIFTIITGVLVNHCNPACVFQNNYGWRVLCNLKQTVMLRLHENGGLKAFFGGGLEFGNEEGFSKSYSNSQPDLHYGKNERKGSSGSKVSKKGVNRQRPRRRFQALHERPNQVANGVPFSSKISYPGKRNEVITVHIPPPAPQLKVYLAPQYFFPPKYPDISAMVHGVKYKFQPSNFSCHSQSFLPGMYADEYHGCKVFHVCDMKGKMASYVCPEMTVFDQEILSCNWWFYVDCDTSHKTKYMNKYISESYRRVAAALKIPDRARSLDLDSLGPKGDKFDPSKPDAVRISPPTGDRRMDQTLSTNPHYRVTPQSKGDFPVIPDTRPVLQRPKVVNRQRTYNSIPAPSSQDHPVTATPGAISYRYQFSPRRTVIPPN